MESVRDNSILKKISAVILMITALVFFSFNVFATTYNPTTYNSYTDAITISNVTYSLRVTQFKALSEGTSMLPGGMETIMFVQFQITNDNNQDALCQIPVFSIDLSDERVITDVYTYAGDLALGVISTGFVIYPTQEFSYDASNKIVVPANSTLTLIGGIGLPAQLNQTGDGTLDTGLRGVHLLNKPYTVTLGTYSHGIPVDLSPILPYIDDIESDIGDIATDINTILSYLDYEGSAFTPQTSSANTSVINIEGNTNLTLRSRRYIFPCYYVTEDIEIDSANDVIVEAGSICYPVCISTYWRNLYSKYDYSCRYNFTCTNVWPANASVQFVSHDSNYADYWYETGRTVYLSVNDNDGTYGYFPAKTIGYSSTWFNVYVPAGTTANFPTYGFDAGTIERIDVDDSRAINVFDLLRKWYKSYNDVNGVDDSSNISDDVANVSDSNHVIEESYYSANASAIEATGLSNYRFSNEQNNGIGQVSSDFMLLWNALGSWNGVYIFSLTMALATFIMRHGGLFTIKRETSDKGGDGD